MKRGEAREGAGEFSMAKKRGKKTQADLQSFAAPAAFDREPMQEKRYYWLKLQKKFFEDKMVKKMRKMPEGDTYCLIYLRLILESVPEGGLLYFEGVESTFAEEMALLLDERVEHVQAVLAMLQAAKRLQPLCEIEYKMVDFDDMTGSESAGAKRTRIHREKQKSQYNTQKSPEKYTACNAVVTKCNTETEKKREKNEEADRPAVSGRKGRDKMADAKPKNPFLDPEV